MTRIGSSDILATCTCFLFFLFFFLSFFLSFFFVCTCNSYYDFSSVQYMYYDFELLPIEDGHSDINDPSGFFCQNIAVRLFFGFSRRDATAYQLYEFCMNFASEWTGLYATKLSLCGCLSASSTKNSEVAAPSHHYLTSKKVNLAFGEPCSPLGPRV